MSKWSTHLRSQSIKSETLPRAETKSFKLLKGLSDHGLVISIRSRSSNGIVAVLFLYLAAKHTLVTSKVSWAMKKVAWGGASWIIESAAWLVHIDDCNHTITLGRSVSGY